MSHNYGSMSVDDDDDTATGAHESLPLSSSSRSRHDNVVLISKPLLTTLLVTVVALIAIVVALSLSTSVLSKDRSNSSRRLRAENACAASSGGAGADLGAGSRSVDPRGWDDASAWKALGTRKRSGFGNTWIRNGTLWDPILGVVHTYDVILNGDNGRVEAHGVGLTPSIDIEHEVQANGAWITPGIVDMHSHLGVYSWPEDAWANSDGNEATSPVLPQMRAQDAYNAADPAIGLTRGGGVTTVLILPGSANAIGGASFTAKLRGSTLADCAIGEPAKGALKFACGENPKRTYGSRSPPQMPASRMGTGWEFRRMFYDAYELRQLQDNWDCLREEGSASGLRPFDAALEPLVDVLKGERMLQIHCYKVEDFTMMLSVADQFNVSVSAFHHALEAWKIPEVLAARNITVATFADQFWFKMEAYEGSVRAGSILSDAGVPVAYKSDHPIIFSRYLAHEAAKAHYYGLPDDVAWQSLTSVPANAIGLGHRVGRIENGYDADVVLWDRHPFRIGAQAKQLWIQSELLEDHADFALVPDYVANEATLQHTGAGACDASPSAANGTFVIRGLANVYTMNATDAIVRNDVTIVVENGIVTCIGSTCDTPTDAVEYTATGAHATPGMFSTGEQLGQRAVNSEPTSQDGVANGVHIYAADGISINRYKRRQVEAVWRAGVTNLVESPQGTALVRGVSVAFHARGNTIADAVVRRGVGLHVTLGNAAKQGGQTSSVSGQVATLRSELQTANASLATSAEATTPWMQVLRGDLTLVAHVDQVDQMVSLLRLCNDFGVPRVTIMGGAEAHLIADELAAAGVSVFVSRWQPATFEKWHQVENAAALLHGAGVRVGVTMSVDPAYPRNVRWDAALAVARGLPWYEGLASVTRNPAVALGLEDVMGTLEVGKAANFVVWSEDPLSLFGHPLLVVLGQMVDCNPKQF